MADRRGADHRRELPARQRRRGILAMQHAVDRSTAYQSKPIGIAVAIDYSAPGNKRENTILVAHACDASSALKATARHRRVSR